MKHITLLVVAAVAIVAILALTQPSFTAKSDTNLAGDARYKESCRDLDNGINSVVASRIETADNEYEDACRSETTLAEYYCEDGEAARTIVSCPLGCENGACVNATNSSVTTNATSSNATNTSVALNSTNTSQANTSNVSTISRQLLNNSQSFGTVNFTSYHCYNLDYSGGVYKNNQMKHFMDPNEANTPSRVVLANPNTGAMLHEQKDTCTTIAGQPAVIERYCAQYFIPNVGLTAVAQSRTVTCASSCVSTGSGDYCQ